MFVERGPGFTTADLASAAGVSEGTIFRYFPDKVSLVAAAREGALGLDTLLPALAEAAESDDLEGRLIAAGHVLTERIAQMARIMEQTNEAHGHSHRHDSDLIAALLAALLPLFAGVESSAGEVAASPEQLANVFLGMLVSNTLFCEKTGTPPLAVDRLVHLLVNGIDR